MTSSPAASRVWQNLELERHGYQPGRMTGIALESADPRADRDELAAKGVEVDAELMAATARCRSCSSSATTMRTT